VVFKNLPAMSTWVVCGYILSYSTLNGAAPQKSGSYDTCPVPKRPSCPFHVWGEPDMTCL
jgi:hypothetical protein